MDGLALCCTLFADGPLTLRRLRAAGVRSLAALERVPDEALAEWLCASVPQARAFAAEARRLSRRIADERVPDLVRSAPATEPARVIEPVPRPREPAAPVAHVAPGAASAPGALRPGLVPGLDACACERLAAAGVRTLQGLAEGAGLALARRTGIPYSTLLYLARGARRAASALPGPRVAPPISARDLVRPEAVRSDEFTLPLDETGPAGPFGHV
jgi:hypothetical protein